MPRQNRVTPFGEIVAVPERGTMLGNRGVLHDDQGHVRRLWQVKRWLICLMEFNGRHRQVMAPDRYTELFFLDEATALAAGHRPCFECRRKSYNAFVDAWAVGNGIDITNGRPTADSIDDRPHQERVGRGRSNRTFRANIDELPDGVFVALDGGVGRAYLTWDGHLLAWSPGGYTGRHPRPVGEGVVVLTPGSTVAAIRAGYVPGVHPSAFEVSRGVPPD
jgi:hypothetical protein